MTPDLRIVLVGTSAAGLLDLRATPLDAATPGVEVHAQVIEQVVSGTYLMRPDFSDGVEQIFLVVLCGAVMLMVPRIGAAWAGLIGFGFAGLAIGLAWMGFDRFGWLLDPVYRALAVGLVFVVTTLVVYLRTERERKFIDRTVHAGLYWGWVGREKAG